MYKLIIYIGINLILSIDTISNIENKHIDKQISNQANLCIHTVDQVQMYQDYLWQVEAELEARQFRLNNPHLQYIPEQNLRPAK